MLFRSGPLEFFRFRGTSASPLTGLRFQFRLEIPDPGFVNSNHFCRNSFPSSRNLCNNCCAISKRRRFCSSLGSCGTHQAEFDVCASVQSKCGRQMPAKFQQNVQFLHMSFCGFPPGFGAHVPHFCHQSTFGVVLIRVVLCAQTSLTKALSPA